MNTKTDSELIEEVVDKIWWMIPNGNENDYSTLTATLTTTIARVRQQYHHELSALIEGERRQNAKLGGRSQVEERDNYFFNIALDRVKALSEGMVGDKEKLCPNCGVDTRKYPHKNCVISSCDCHISLEKGKHWPGCVHYKNK